MANKKTDNTQGFWRKLFSFSWLKFSWPNRFSAKPKAKSTQMPQPEGQRTPLKLSELVSSAELPEKPTNISYKNEIIHMMEDIAKAEKGFKHTLIDTYKPDIRNNLLNMLYCDGEQISLQGAIQAKNTLEAIGHQFENREEKSIEPTSNDETYNLDKIMDNLDKPYDEYTDLGNGIEHIKALFGNETITGDKDSMAEFLLISDKALNDFIAIEKDKRLDDDDEYDYDDSFNPTL